MSDADDTTGIASTTPRHSLSSAGVLSYSSSSSISPSSNSSSSAKSAVNECLGAWLNYLQILNNLCASGYRLAQTIAMLEQWTNQEIHHAQSSQTQLQQNIQSTSGQPQQSSQQNIAISHSNNFIPTTSPMATQFINAWDDLARATAVATSTVKSHIVSVLQDFVTQSVNFHEADGELRDHNQQIVMETTQTMINIQHQFCVASYDSFSSLMCCFMCQTPVGFPHDADCAFQKRHTSNTSNEMRSQTPSPHFGTMNVNLQKSAHSQSQQQQQQSQQSQQHNDAKNILFGSGSSSDHSGGVLGPNAMSITTRGPSPHQDIRGPSPVQGFLENIRGPLPNPGHLLTMKTPFYRCSRSPLNFPLFPLNGQRRWSEAAAGEVKSESTFMDAESQMRRWSMPWEASKSERNTVTWHQTRVMPISKLAVPISATTIISRSSNDRSQTTTPDSIYQQSNTSQDGLAEAIQLLSCRPSRMNQYQPPVGSTFIEEPQNPSNTGTYEMWSSRDQDRLPCIKFSSSISKGMDEQQPSHQFHPP